jgi:hypothetical protein
MVTRRLDRAEWQSYFDSVSRHLPENEAEIEVLGLAAGNQVQASWRPLIGFAYDPNRDEIEVAVDGLDHNIHRPASVFVEENRGRLQSLRVVDGEGQQHVIQLKKPLRRQGS